MQMLLLLSTFKFSTLMICNLQPSILLLYNHIFHMRVELQCIGYLAFELASAPQAEAPLSCIGDAASDEGLLESSYDEVVRFWGSWSHCILVIGI